MIKKTIVWCLVLFIGMLSVGQASASCVYNKASKQVKFHLDCSTGLFPTCFNYWDLAPNDHACRPGKAGFVDVKKTLGRYSESVEKHGSVVLYEERTRYKLVSFHSNGSVKSYTYIYK